MRPAADLSEPVRLDLPVDQFRAGSNIQWESPTSVLVQGEQAARCDTRSGACHVVDLAGRMAWGETIRPDGQLP